MQALHVHDVRQLRQAVRDTHELNTFHNYSIWTVIHSFDTAIKDVIYPGCVKNVCRGRVWRKRAKLYFCQRCMINYTKFQWRYNLKACLEDNSGRIWAKMYDEVAQPLLGVSAEVLAELYYGGPNLNAYHQIFETVIGEFKLYLFVLRVALRIENVEITSKGTYYCPTCRRHSLSCRWRYKSQAFIRDNLGETHKVTMFDEAAHWVLKKSSFALGHVHFFLHDAKEYNFVFNDALKRFQSEWYYFTLKVKLINSNGTLQMYSIVQYMKKVDQ